MVTSLFCRQGHLNCKTDSSYTGLASKNQKHFLFLKSKFKCRYSGKAKARGLVGGRWMGLIPKVRNKKLTTHQRPAGSLRMRASPNRKTVHRPAPSLDNQPYSNQALYSAEVTRTHQDLLDIKPATKCEVHQNDI